MNKPKAGQKWHIPSLAQNSAPFVTLLGTYGGSPPIPTIPSISAHLYRLAAGQPDIQTPHSEDELYYVLAGSRTLSIDNGTEKIPVAQGDLIFVPAGAAHRFEGPADITLLVIFAPEFSGPKQG